MFEPPAYCPASAGGDDAVGSELLHPSVLLLRLRVLDLNGVGVRTWLPYRCAYVTEETLSPIHT